MPRLPAAGLLIMTILLLFGGIDGLHTVKQHKQQKQLTGSDVVDDALQHNSIVMTMIIRDEAVNIRSNLHLWIGIVDYFVFLIDERTIDDSELFIRNILGPTGIPFEIFPNYFDGFGPSRTRSLEYAWDYFPQATHVWIADPDWRPEVSSINKEDLIEGFDAYRFTIIDRSGITTRQCDWILAHKEGLGMRYHLHEVLHFPESYVPVSIKWVVHEVEQKGSWHTTVGHENSFAAKRTLFDLDLLYKDLEVFGHDPHVHKYLGITHLSYVSSVIAEEKKSRVKDPSEGLSPELMQHLEKGNYYCELRSNPQTQYDAEFEEERWECLLQMAMGDIARANSMYIACHNFSPREPRCMYSLVELHDKYGDIDLSFHYLQILLQMRIVPRAGINFRAMGSCLIPHLAFSVMLKYANQHSEFDISSGFVKFLHMLMKMVSDKECENFIPQSSKQQMAQIVDAMMGLMGIAKLPSICSDTELQQYLMEKDYHINNCNI